MAVMRSPLSTGTQTNEREIMRGSPGGPEGKTAAPPPTFHRSRSTPLRAKALAHGERRTSTGRPVSNASRDGPVTARATGGTTSSTPETYWYPSATGPSLDCVIVARMKPSKSRKCDSSSRKVRMIDQRSRLEASRRPMALTTSRRRRWPSMAS